MLRIRTDGVLYLSGSQPCTRGIPFDMQNAVGEVLVKDPVDRGTCVLEDVVMHYNSHLRFFLRHEFTSISKTHVFLANPK